MTRDNGIALLLVMAIGSGCSSGPGQISGADMAMPPAAPDMVVPYYLPAATSLTPFLSRDAQHVFTMADIVIDAANKHYYAVLETDAGRIVLDLFADQTPVTVNSFVFLALHHFFDGIAFHRVLEGFVAQAGDPNTIDQDPSTGGAGGPGYYFGLEIVNGLKYNSAGVVGMARTQDPNSNGSQFFITLAAEPSLDGKYTIFARVFEGLNVLPSITRTMPPPMTYTRMQRVYITEKAK